MRKKKYTKKSNILFCAKNIDFAVVQRIYMYIYIFDIMQFMLMRSRTTIVEAEISRETHKEGIKCREL